MDAGAKELAPPNPAAGSFRMWVLVGTLLALASCDVTATGPQDHRMGAEGGVAKLEDGAIQILVPPGVLSEAVWFTAFPARSVPASPLLVPGTSWEIGPLGTTFSRPVTLTLSYDPARLPAGVGEEGLALYQVLDGTWTLLEYASVDPAANTVAGGTLTLGRFGIKGMELTGMEVLPTATTLAPGSSVQLSAAPRGEDGRTLPGRPVTWSTSDPEIATVDSAGVVTGASEGEATITVASGTHQATALIHVWIPVASVQISPADPFVNVGSALQLTATPKDAEGRALTGRSVTWSSGNPGVLTVDSTGLVGGRSLGSAIVTATVDGTSGMTSVSVHGDLRISTETLASALVGLAYEQTLAASGGNGTYRWALSSGTLPAGLTLNTETGAIAGTPTSVGVDTFTVQVASAGLTAQKVLSILVTPVPVASVQISPASVNLAVGDTVAFTATARDASGTILSNRTLVWYSSDEEVASISSEGLMAGLSEGSTTISVLVDGFPAWASAHVRDLLTITDSTLAAGIESQPYADTLRAGGGDESYSWSLLGDTLPTGLSLGDSTGVVSGTPTTQDSIRLRIAVTSGDGQADTVDVTLVIRGVLEVTTTTLVEGAEGASYSDTLQATGGERPYRWSVSAGSLPSGLSLNASTGVISGTPASSGAPSFTVEAESEDEQTHTALLTLTVRPSPVASVTLSPASAALTVGETQPFTATPRNAGGSVLSGRTVTWSTGDPGVAGVSGTGLVTAEGVGTTSITATSEGVSNSVVVAVHAVLGITNGTLAGGVTGAPYEDILAATGGDGVYTWTVVAGALPAGLSLDGTTGVISGTPAGAGTYGFTIQVASGDGQTASKALSIIIS